VVVDPMLLPDGLRQDWDAHLDKGALPCLVAAVGGRRKQCS